MSNAGKPLVLLVEDNEDDYFIFRQLCSREFPDVDLHHEEDGESAQSFLKRSPIKPALIISDLKMPRVTGLELLKWVRSNEEIKTTPFVVFSDSNAPQDRAAASQLGATEYDVKPSDVGEFGPLLRRWVRMDFA
jgi:CheY-like chemotaxis protein